MFTNPFEPAQRPFFHPSDLVKRLLADYPQGLPQACVVLTIDPQVGKTHGHVETGWGIEVDESDTRTKDDISAEYNLVKEPVAQIYDAVMQLGARIATHALTFQLGNMPLETPKAKFEVVLHLPAFTPDSPAFGTIKISLRGYEAEQQGGHKSPDPRYLLSVLNSLRDELAPRLTLTATPSVN